MTTPINLSTDFRGRLVLHREGEPDVSDVRIRRVFPWSDPDRFVSIRSSEGKELVLVEDLGKLGADARGIVEAHLAKVSFVPEITRVDEVDTRYGYQLWSVQTDRGPAEFRVQEREDIRFLNDGRFRLKDADGNIYVLPPLDRLDERSRRAVETVV